MFRAFDEDNTRAFAGHALDCRNSIRINLNMARSYHIALSESIGFGEGRENDPMPFRVRDFAKSRLLSVSRSNI